MFKVIRAFADARDNGYIYNAGDPYPRSGVIVDKKRLEELASNRNRTGAALIMEDNPREGLSEAKEGTEKTKTNSHSSKPVEAKRRAKKRQGENA